MKKNILLCIFALLICACNNDKTPKQSASNEDNRQPETFEEFMNSIDKDREYTIGSSRDGYTTYQNHYLSRDLKPRYKNDKEYMAEFKKEQKRDSLVDINAEYIINKYKKTAAKAYQYENHVDGDSVECILALRMVKDSLNKEKLTGHLSEDFYYYPDCFIYRRYISEWDGYGGTKFAYVRHDIFYKHLTEVPNKQRTDSEATKQLVKDYIGKQKGVKKLNVSYVYDEGFATPYDQCRVVSFSRNINALSRSSVKGTRYLISAKSKEEYLKILNELWALFSDHVKNNYSEVDGHWGFECKKSMDLDTLRYDNRNDALQMTIVKDKETGEMFHVQVGYDNNGVHLLLLNIETKRFYIPSNWMRIVSIHNDIEEWESDDFKYSNSTIWGRTGFAKVKVVGRKMK